MFLHDQRTRNLWRLRIDDSQPFAGRAPQDSSRGYLVSEDNYESLTPILRALKVVQESVLFKTCTNSTKSYHS